MGNAQANSLIEWEASHRTNAKNEETNMIKHRQVLALALTNSAVALATQCRASGPASDWKEPDAEDGLIHGYTEDEWQDALKVFEGKLANPEPGIGNDDPIAPGEPDGNVTPNQIVKSVRDRSPEGARWVAANMMMRFAEAMMLMGGAFPPEPIQS